MKKQILNFLIALILILSNISLNANNLCQQDKAIYGITPQEIDFLRYVNVSNKFDRSIIDYEIGEFILNNDSNQIRISLNDGLIHRTYTKGSGNQGVDTLLSEIISTNNFEVPQGDNKIQFMRMMQNIHSCSQVEDTVMPDIGPLGGPVLHSWHDEYWKTGKNWILDDQEFVLRIKDANTLEDLFILDSVGIKRNYDSLLAPRYGTNPDQFFQKVTLPGNLQGKEVFIQLIVKREGFTDYGMDMYVSGSWINKSVLYEMTPAPDILPCGDIFFESVYNDYFDKIIAHCDTIKSSTGWLPRYYDKYIILDDKLDEFRTRYYHQRLNDNGTIHYEEKQIDHSIAGKISTFNNNGDRILEIYPNPAESILNIKYNAEQENLTLQIYNDIGLLMGEFLISNDTFELDLVNYMAGTYIIVLKDNDVIISTNKFIKI